MVFRRKRAGIYLRQSLDQTGEGDAVARQLKDCKALCDRKGWTVADTYNDNDTSASALKPRKEYQRLLRDVRAGLIDVVAVWDLDRLTRRPIEVEEWITLAEQHGVNLVTIGENIDLSTDNGRLFLRIKAAVARAEVERKSARQKAGNLQRATRGIPHAGPSPFGYRRDDLGREDSANYVIEPREAEAVRRAYQQILAGATLRGIAKEWTEAGFPTTAKNGWAGHTVGRMLQSPSYAGIVVYEGKVYGKGNWESLVSEDVWRSVVAKLTDPQRRTATDYARRYMLPGVALCGVEGCDLKVSTGRSHRGVRTYICAKRHLARAAEPVDELITGLVVERLSQPDAVQLLHDDSAPEAAALNDQAQVLRAQQDELAIMLAEGELTRRSYSLANSRVTAQLEHVESQRVTTSRADILRDLVGSEVAERWESLHVDRQAAVINALMTIVLRPPGRGRKTFDPSSIEVEWK